MLWHSRLAVGHLHEPRGLRHVVARGIERRAIAWGTVHHGGTETRRADGRLIIQEFQPSNAVLLDGD